MLVATSAPAEAAAIAVGSMIDFSSLPNGGVSFDATTGSLNFTPDSITIGQITLPVQPIESGLGTGSFTGVGPLATILDLNLVDNGAGIFSLAAPQDNFISFINLPPLLSELNDVQFTLTNFILDTNTGSSTAFEGFFARHGQTTPAVGQFTSQMNFRELSSWSLSVRAVPTPALLPGLVGMGIASLRRKSEEESTKENA
ncbi:MAG TPA: PTPA-CTERM sorting domain-containing protein [Leptolyngbyaceae cyanobacterium M65_K2018_010]|nr:PTPA-CTERM sorting domain-containing protein [Leptolyngbyaceae cyanobacterium M65_K2018_010]